MFENEKPATFGDAERSMYARSHALDNVVLSPHIAGWTVDSKIKLAQTIVDKIVQLYR